MQSNKESNPDFRYELEYSKEGRIVAGVDEVGRGSIAGPIVAGAVIFSSYDKIFGFLKEIKDSKKLSASKRIKLAQLVYEKAAACSIGIVDNDEIDTLGIGAANIVAFQRALDQIKCNFALIDGRHFRGFTYDYLCLEKGESKSISIAAASIIAKVFRDDLMLNISKNLPYYDFGKNKGYGSKKHYSDLKAYGLSKYHRKTFLKFLFDSQSPLF